MPSTHLLAKSRRRSYASLILEAHGVSQAKLADALEVSTSSLSRMLRGIQPLPPWFEKALRVTLGADEARQVTEAIAKHAGQ